MTGARAVAIAAGELRYFTGKPCKRGHIAERHVDSGTCLECARVAAAERYRSNPEPYKAQKAILRAQKAPSYLNALAVHRDRRRRKAAVTKELKAQARVEQKAQAAVEKKALEVQRYAERKALDPRLLSRAEAKLQGVDHYWTGKLCVNGHTEFRNARSGCCMQCSREAALATYHADPAAAQQRSRKWKAANVHKVRVQARGWYARNSQKARGWEARRYVLNRDRIIGRSKQYYSRVKHSESFKVQQKVLRARRRALMRKAAGHHSAEDIRQIYNAQKGRCAYCRCRLGDAYHVDHIISLARGGTNWRSNIQLACKTCNLRKNAKHPLAFARELGRLL